MFWPHKGPYVLEILQNTKIIIPGISRNVLVPHTGIMLKVLICHLTNSVKTWKFTPLSGTHFGLVRVPMSLKSSKTPKLLFPGISRNVLIPDIDIMLKVLICYLSNSVKIWIFSPLLGTHFGLGRVPMSLKSTETPKLLFHALVGMF